MFLKRSCSIYSIKIDSQPYAGAKREIFWRATGQSNLADRIEFQSDDVTKMIFLKLWVLFNCSEQPT